MKLRIINIIMTYIIADPCVGTCDTACVEVCPVDCIHGPDDPEGSGEEAKAHVNLSVLWMPFMMKTKFPMNTKLLSTKIIAFLVKTHKTIFINE